RRGRISGEVELLNPTTPRVVVDADGRRIPVAIDIARTERAFETEIPAAELKRTVAELSHPTMLGRTVNSYQLDTRSDGRPELALSLSRAALSDLNLEEFRTRISTEVPDTGMVRIGG